jgi:hypothetical protein
MQYRGLPHAHIVYRYATGPDRGNKEDVIKFVDSLITARFPDPIDIDASDAEKAEYDEYVDLIRSKMLHKCSDSVNGCTDQNGNCKKRYDQTVIREQSDIDEKGFPQYKRLSKRDLLVVPHNKNILLDWKGHANLEYCGSALTIIYLYKVWCTSYYCSIVIYVMFYVVPIQRQQT